VQHAVDRHPDPDLLLIGLDVDVGGIALDRLGYQAVDQLGRRAALDGRGHLRGGISARLLLFLQDLQVSGIHVGLGLIHGLHHILQHAGRPVLLVDGRPDGGLGGYHRTDLETGGEFYVLHGQDIVGVDHGHGHAPSQARQGDQSVLLGYMGRYQFKDGLVDLVIVQVDRGDVELLAQEGHHLVLGDKSQFYQQGAQPLARGLLFLKGLLQLLRADHPGLEKHISNF